MYSVMHTHPCIVFHTKCNLIPYIHTHTTVTVINPEVPVIVDEPEDREVGLFMGVNLTCEATGQPLPTYSWFRDGVFLVNTSDSVLFIHEARPEDRGLYTCIATNVQGSSNASSPGLLTISGEPNT